MGAKGPLRPLSLAAGGLRPCGWVNAHPAARAPCGAAGAGGRNQNPNRLGFWRGQSLVTAHGCGPLAMMFYESKPPLGLGFRLGLAYRPVRHSHSNSA